MRINDKVNTIIEETEQAVSGIIASEANKSITTKTEVMPGTVDIFDELALKNYITGQIKTKEAWIDALRNDKGIAIQLGRLDGFDSAHAQFPELNRLRSVMKEKYEKRQEKRKVYEDLTGNIETGDYENQCVQTQNGGNSHDD